LEKPVERARLLKTAYVITSQRAIGVYGQHIFSKPLDSDTRFRLGGTDSDTLEIWSNAEQARAEEPPMRFRHLADGDVAYAVLEGVLNAGQGG
jgi:hypothetical protein